MVPFLSHWGIPQTLTGGVNPAVNAPQGGGVGWVSHPLGLGEIIPWVLVEKVPERNVYTLDRDWLHCRVQWRKVKSKGLTNLSHYTRSWGRMTFCLSEEQKPFTPKCEITLNPKFDDSACCKDIIGNIGDYLECHIFSNVSYRRHRLFFSFYRRHLNEPACWAGRLEEKRARALLSTNCHSPNPGFALWITTCSFGNIIPLRRCHTQKLFYPFKTL